jgi:type II secretion system protein N
MSPPISQRPPPEGAGLAAEEAPVVVEGRALDPRLEALREKLKIYGPYLGYGGFFLFSLLLFVYWSFPYERIRDRIVAEFEKGQRATPSAAHQTLSIGRLEPNWFTGVVLRDVTLTTHPADPTKATTKMQIDEVRARVSLGSIFSAAKDVTFVAKAFGGTIEGSVTHKLSATKDDGKSATTKKDGPRYDRTIKLEIDGVNLGEVSAVRDALGTVAGGTVKGTVDVTYGEGRIDKANGAVALEIEGLWISDGKTPFKIPVGAAAMELALPQIAIGNVPIQVSVKNGVARIEKMEARGKDLDLNVDGPITLRENAAASDLGINLRFKFNDSYRKKDGKAEGLLLMLDTVPELRQGKRQDGFYELYFGGPMATVRPRPGRGGGGGSPSLPFGGTQFGGTP